MVNLIREHRAESDFISADSVNTADLLLGDIVSIRWAPDREASLCCMGDARYEVIEQKNSKLCKGDTLKAIVFKKGAPLVCADVVRQGQNLGNYIADKVNGLTDLICHPVSTCPPKTE